MGTQIDFLGHSLNSPLVLASGIWGTTSSLLERAARAGCGTVTAKSCGPTPRAGHVNPSCLDWGNGLINAIGLALALGIWVIRSISRPLRRAIAYSESISHGDLTQQIEARGSNETEQLLHGLKAMQTSLVMLVSAVHQGAASVSVASGEIAQGNDDLSARTERQASALQETAASMEELNSTVRMNADNSRQANQMAQSASAPASMTAWAIWVTDGTLGASFTMTGMPSGAAAAFT